MNIMDEIRTKKRVLIMGIVNVTPDSFSDGGDFVEREDAVIHSLELKQQGADIIDIGGESTRPGAAEVPLEEEIRRTIPVIQGIREKTGVPISIDTYKAEVAKQALEAGANIINDISALRFDPNLSGVAADNKVPIILMHMQGTPQTMQKNPTYKDPVGDIIAFFKERINAAIKSGIDPDNIIVDPGIGFGKRTEHNYEILRRLDEFQILNKPILLGTSRKSFLGDILDLPAKDRLEGTIASNVVGILKGANILRVHDVQEVYRATQVAIRCR